ncbi:unnamed protein product [Ectocarpus sp. CCAP 1310/34]|nr:unnamed protein product [Ectocarpus sp. CCAP 1310/34]
MQTTKLGLSGIMIRTQATKFAAEINVTNFTASDGWLHRFLSRYGLVHINLHGEAGDMNVTNFTASNGWLHRFLSRYGLVHINLHGEARDVNKAAAEKEIAQIWEQLQGFDVELIFNMEETGLFHRCFPRGTYVTRSESAAGLNQKTARGSKAMKAKDRCTVVSCCNTTGSLKVPLAVIHTAKDPMVFRHVRKPACPYYAQKSGWLDSSLCQRWFDEVFVPFVKKTTGKKVALLWDNCPGHRIKNDDPQIVIIFLPPNVTSVFQPMDMGCRGLNEAGQPTMLDVTEILSQKWESFLDQTVIRCWLKATILPGEHESALKDKDTRLDREDPWAAALDDLCDMVEKMSMPECAKDLDARSKPRVWTENLFVESASGLTEEVRSAMRTWLSVEDDKEVLRDEVELEMEEVTENMSNVHVEEDVSSEEEGDHGRPVVHKSTISTGKVRSRVEDVRSFLYTHERDGEFSETAHLLPKFTHDTQVKRRAKEWGEVQATLWDMWRV